MSAVELPTTINSEEIERFSSIAAEWWDSQGQFRPLHQFNPTRLAYIKEKICSAFKRNPLAHRPLEGLRVLDIGCGGGLLCEPMARLGATVIGADASQVNIDVARFHAIQSNLLIDYRVTAAETLANAAETFDIILNMEVVEHVANVDFFISSCSSMVKSDGLMFIATINRTLKALGLAIIGAEYILGWLPRGTHQYEKLVRPEELKHMLNAAGLDIIDQTGMTYNPFIGNWNRSHNMDVNYILLAQKKA